MSFRFTVCVWLYIHDYCTHDYYCSIVHRLTIDDNLLTPLVLLTNNGHLHVQVHDKRTNEASASLTRTILPKHEWFRIVLAFNNNDWHGEIRYGREFSRVVPVDFVCRVEFQVKDREEGLLFIGGSASYQTFVGYIGDVLWYRGRALHPDKVAMPSRDHAMFALTARLTSIGCHNDVIWLRGRSEYLISRLDGRTGTTRVCHSPLRQWLRWRLRMPLRRQCAPYRHVPAPYMVVDDIIRSAPAPRINMTSVAEGLLQRALDYIQENGLSRVGDAIPWLRLAGCYGKAEANFMLSSVLQNGIGLKADLVQSRVYLMSAAVHDHTPSLLALAHQHLHGLQGLPQDRMVAYAYYCYVSGVNRKRMTKHPLEDVQTEMVRLTDDQRVRSQTDEMGDIFQWLKMQAHQGVVEAQQQLASLLFWGAQGVQRNLRAAVDYYRMGAAAEDGVALFNLGVVLLKGQGVDKDEKEALTHLKKSAAQGNPNALTTLGWHADLRGDHTAAARLWEEAFKQGNVDAAHNLGHYWFTGTYPGRAADKTKAYLFFEYAATRGQYDSGLMMAYYYLRGPGSIPRDEDRATRWAQYTAEKNHDVGRYLRRALTAYTNADWSAAMFYYAMAAHTGVEVATFNMAVMCDENPHGLAQYIETNCAWSNYNLSTLREEHMVDATALIKMGDYFWYYGHCYSLTNQSVADGGSLTNQSAADGGHCSRARDVETAARYYVRAALKHNPQALFNLATMVEATMVGATMVEATMVGATMVEEEANINSLVWAQLGLSRTADKYAILTELYSRCRSSHIVEAYIPCTMALMRVRVMVLWHEYARLIMVVFSLLIAAILVLIVTFSFYRTNGVAIDNYNGV